MPLFDWVGAFRVGWNIGMYLKGELDRFDEDVEGEHFGVTVTKDAIELAGLEAQRWESERDEEMKLARSRWLEANDALRSFPCGIVPDPVLEATDPGRAQPPPEPEKPLLPSDPGWAAPERPAASRAPAEPQPLTALRPMQVIAAVLPTDLAFIREQSEGDEVEEVGRLPRRAIQDVDVLDVAGAHVPEPTQETFEDPALRWAVLRWLNQATPDEDRFLFRSTWLAWQAARRLLAARQG